MVPGLMFDMSSGLISVRYYGIVHNEIVQIFNSMCLSLFELIVYTKRKQIDAQGKVSSAAFF